MLFASSTIVVAQDSTARISNPSQLSLDSEIYHSVKNGSSIEIMMPLFAIALIVILAIQITRYVLDHKLKNKIIDRSISEQLAASILEKSVTDKKDDTIKWAFLLLGLSGGLTVAYYTKPLDIHSLAIIAFSFGVSFLSYYFFLKNSQK